MSSRTDRNDRQGIFPVSHRDDSTLHHLVLHFTTVHNAREYGNKNCQEDICNAYHQASEAKPYETIHFDDLHIGEPIRAAKSHEIDDNPLYPEILLKH